MRIYKRIANLLVAVDNCSKSGNDEWHEKHLERLNELMDMTAPSGSGFNNGTRINFGASRRDRLVFNTSFHHMNDVGMYSGWTDHAVIVTADLLGINVKVTGRDKNGIKDYIGDTFYEWLKQEE